MMPAGHIRTIVLILMIAAAGCGGLRIQRALKQADSDWRMFGRDGARTGAVPDPVMPPLTQLWETDINGGVGNGSPLVVDSFLVIGNLRGELQVMNVSTGKRIGAVSLGDAIQGSPVIAGSVAFAATANSAESHVAIDLFEGKALWKKAFGDLEVSPLLLGRRLYFGSTSGTFYCVDRESGAPVWQFELPDNRTFKGIRSSAATDSTVVVFAAEDGAIYALSADSGKVRWRVQTGAAVEATPVIARGVVGAGNLAGDFTAVNIADGTTAWKHSLGAGIFAAAAFADGLFVVGTTGGKMYAMRGRDGTIAWQQDMGGVVSAAVAIAGNIVYAGTLTKELVALRLLDGSVVWKDSVSGRIKTSPAVARGEVFIATDDRTVLAYTGATP